VELDLGVRTALDAENEFAHHWFPEFEHQEIHEIEAGGIGEQSWAVRGGTDDAGFVEISWRRANAVLAVYVNCRPCQSDLADAARRWAQKIDGRHVPPPTDRRFRPTRGQPPTRHRISGRAPQHNPW
jgi:hypothetical protein